MQLSEKELKKVQEQLSLSNRVKTTIGELEVNYQNQKQKLFAELADYQSKLGLLIKDMEDEYGKVSLNIETGELTPIEEEVSPSELASV
jgi:molybdopterin converting factor small subunit